MSLFARIVLIYLIIINLTGLFLMGLDKYKARKHLWRIPEKTLFLTALLGGSIGTLTGMHLFRHKTRHWYFVMGMPAILIIQAGFVIYLRFLR